MRILSAPAHVTLGSAEALSISLLVHNESDEDVVCFPTIEGLDPAAAEAVFEPSLGFIEGRCAVKFEVSFAAVPIAGRPAVELAARWMIYCDGAAAAQAPIALTVEPHRGLTARVSEDARPHLVLANEGSVRESIVIGTLEDAPAALETRSRWTLDPGTLITVPLDFDRAAAAPLTLSIIGGPRPLLVDTPVVESARAALNRRRMGLAKAGRNALLGAGAVAAAFVMAFPGNRAPSPALPRLAGRPAIAAGPMLAEAMPFVALDAGLERLAVHIGDSDRRLAARIAPQLRTLRRRVIAAAWPAPKAPEIHRQLAAAHPRSARPHLTSLMMPAEAKAGSSFTVSFRSQDARSVRVVAKVGPTVVRAFVVKAADGRVILRAPQTYHGSRLLTVRVYAQNASRVSSREAFVSIVPA